MDQKLSYERICQLREKTHKLIARLCELFDIVGIYYDAPENLCIDTLYLIDTVDVTEDPDRIYRSPAVRGHILEAISSAMGACSHLRLLYSQGGLTDFHCRQALVPMLERNLAVLQSQIRYLEEEATRAVRRQASG